MKERVTVVMLPHSRFRRIFYWKKQKSQIREIGFGFVSTFFL